MSAPDFATLSDAEFEEQFYSHDFSSDDPVDADEPEAESDLDVEEEIDSEDAEEAFEGEEEILDEVDSEEGVADEADDLEEAEEDDGEEDEALESAPSAEGLERIFEPFKAGGRDVQVESVDEAISLMQRGIGMSKNLAKLKPYRRAGELLAKKGLLADETKLALLVEAGTGDKAALSKLLRDLNVDPLDLTEESGNTYKPKVQLPTESSLATNDVIEELQETTDGKEMLAEMRTSYDPVSIQAFMSNPTLRTQINDHRASGVYQVVMAEVERRKLLGSTLNGAAIESLPVLDAYKQVGEEMVAQGKFATPSEPTGNAGNAETAADGSKPKLKTRKKAAQSTSARRTPSSRGSAKEPDWKSMSDDEFDKQMAKLGLSNF